MSRFTRKFSEMNGRAALVTFIMAYDPSREESLGVLKALPGAGADIIELGMPFSDPMADGPAIQEAGIRALKAGAKLSGILEMVREFRKGDAATPLVLMGYYNPLLSYGVEKFAGDVAEAGVDGLIIVDLPPEEEEELATPARKKGLDIIRLIAPTTGEERAARLLSAAGGFVYYISITGITGTAEMAVDEAKRKVASLKKLSPVPVAVGFGIKTPEQVRQAAQFADAVVIGSAIVRKKPQEIAGFVGELAGAVK